MRPELKERRPSTQTTQIYWKRARMSNEDKNAPKVELEDEPDDWYA
jgi:hypothetical protein